MNSVTHGCANSENIVMKWASNIDARAMRRGGRGLGGVLCVGQRYTPRACGHEMDMMAGYWCSRESSKEAYLLPGNL